MATTVLGLKTFAASDPVDYNEINDNYNKIDSGVKTALQGRAAHNLLDNSDFTNPVNQRGVTSVVDNWKYLVDRWVCTNVSSDAPIIVNTNGITLNNAAGTQTQGIRQYISIKDGTYTVAAKTDSSIWIRTFTYSNKTITNISSYFDGKGQIYVAVSGDNIYIAIQAFAGYSIKVEWAALYEGSYDASTLPAYQPKGYAAELAECQLYYLPLNHQLLGSGYTFNGGAALLVPRKMRIDAPSFVASGTIIARVNGADYPLTLSSVTTYGSMIKVDFASNTIPVNYPCAFYSDAPGVSLNADL